MDTRKFDNEGKTICPECKKHYRPALGERFSDSPIQVQFPKSTQVQREQLMTGLCSQKCWNKHLGLGKPIRAKPRKKTVKGRK